MELTLKLTSEQETVLAICSGIFLIVVFGSLGFVAVRDWNDRRKG